MDEKYLEYQDLCIRYPYLDIFDVPDSHPIELNEKQKKEELIAFTMLISIFERAFLMYHDQSSDLKSKQWSGWNEYIKSYCERKNFRIAWKICGSSFDSDFQEFVKIHLSSHTLWFIQTLSIHHNMMKS